MYSVFKARKLVVPSLPPRHVARPRLTAALDAATRGPLTVIAAGPASGKTVLVAEWVRSRRVRTAWVSLEPEDNTAGAFWVLVGDALERAGLGPVQGETDPRRPLSDETLERLAGAVSHDEPLYLVLDDAHVLTASTIIGQLDALLRLPLEGLHVVLAARSDPILPLHRYRMAGHLAELRAVDMAMTAAEVDAMLAVHGLKLDEATREVLTARTEGWVAGLRLSMVRMEASDEPERFVNAFAMDRGSVGEYLLEEVLAALDAPARRLLIRTSPCELVSGPLADAICEDGGGTATLERLAETNSFVTPVPHSEGWFRYHPLMREVLVHLLASEPVESRRVLDGRAARWHDDAGNAIEALHHAVQARAWPHAADLLARGAFARLFLSDGERAVRNLDTFVAGSIGDRAPVRARLELAAAQAAVAAATGDLPAAQKLLETLSDDPDPWGGGSDAKGILAGLSYAVLADYARLLVATRDGQEAAAETVAERLLATDGDGPFGVFALTQLGATDIWLGRSEQAGERLLTALERARALGMAPLELECTGLLAIEHCSWGHVSRAEELVVEGAKVLRANPQLRGRQTTAHHVAAAELAMTKGDLDGFEVEMARVEEVLDPEMEPALSSTRSLMRAKALQATGHHEAARAAILDDPTLTARGSYNLVAIGRAMLAESASQTGHPVHLDNFPTSEDEPNEYVANIVGLAHARAELAEGDLEGAERLVRRVVTASAPAASLPVLVEAVLVGSEVALAAGDEGRAVEQVVHAIDLGRGGGVVLPFVEAGPRLMPLLARHSTLVERWPVPLDHVSEQTAASGDATPSRLPEPLTDREMSVLRWLTTMMSVAEIADELCVSSNTVKTHVAAIYRKLGVARRRDAVARGRELRLL